jgi:hypothetical protein
MHYGKSSNQRINLNQLGPHFALLHARASFIYPMCTNPPAEAPRISHVNTRPSTSLFYACTYNNTRSNVQSSRPSHPVLILSQNKISSTWCALTGWGESADRKIILPSDIIVGCPLVCAKLDSRLRMTKSRFQKRKPKTLSDVLFQDNYPLLKVYEKTSNTNKFNLYITP